MRLLLAITVLACGLLSAAEITYPLHKSFDLQVYGLPRGITPVSLRVVLTSMCDDAQVVTSSGSYRRNGKYFATLLVPQQYSPCQYRVDVFYWTADGDSELYYDPEQTIRVE